MARYVVLEFDDNDDAERYVKEDRWDIFCGDVIGVYAKPTKFCHCVGSKAKRMAFTRTARFGWWVHVDCKKPTEAWAKGMLLPDGRAGVCNLLYEDGITPE